jgi:hypothetical protein
MKTYWGNDGIALRILDLGTRWRLVVSFTPRQLYSQRKSLRYPLDRRLGGPQTSSGSGGEEKNSQPPPGIEPQNPDRPARSRTSTNQNEIIPTFSVQIQLKFNRIFFFFFFASEKKRAAILRNITFPSAFICFLQRTHTVP